MEEIRRQRCDARGETLHGAELTPERESRRALYEWTKRQLYSSKSEHHAHVVAFHDFFPQLCKMGKAEAVAPAVQKFLDEIAESLELVRLRTFSSLLAAPAAGVRTPHADAIPTTTRARMCTYFGLARTGSIRIDHQTDLHFQISRRWKGRRSRQ